MEQTNKLPQEAVVISTRVRLARNLSGFPFPGRMTREQGEAVIQAVCDALLNSNSYIASEFSFVDPASLSENQRISLVERHLCSPEFISDCRGRGLILSKDENTSIMINEEDHIRIQVLSDSLLSAYEWADRIDALLSERLQIAYDQQLGYLTQCPSNLGTGMRASLMLHLPALSEAGAISRIAANLSKLGITVRGTFGEGTDVYGAVYQISNQISLGLSEQEAIDNLVGISVQLIEEEKKAQLEMARTIVLQDKVSRALGILKNAMVLSCNEYLGLASLMRWGVSAGLIAGINGRQITALTEQVQPATLMVRRGITDMQERDFIRAGIVREVFEKVCVAEREEKTDV